MKVTIYIDFNGQLASNSPLQGLTFDHSTCYMYCEAGSQIKSLGLLGSSKIQLH